MVKTALNFVLECPCTSGCPKCIHDFRCEEYNVRLEKDLALEILQVRESDPARGRRGSGLWTSIAIGPREVSIAFASIAFWAATSYCETWLAAACLLTAIASMCLALLSQDIHQHIQENAQPVRRMRLG